MSTAQIVGIVDNNFGASATGGSSENKADWRINQRWGLFWPECSDQGSRDAQPAWLQM